MSGISSLNFGKVSLTMQSTLQICSRILLSMQSSTTRRYFDIEATCYVTLDYHIITEILLYSRLDTVYVGDDSDL